MSYRESGILVLVGGMNCVSLLCETKCQGVCFHLGAPMGSQMHTAMTSDPESVSI